MYIFTCNVTKEFSFKLRNKAKIKKETNRTQKNTNNTGNCYNVGKEKEASL